MKGNRRMALAMAVPMVAVSLSGAATNPTVTYHGVFDKDATLSATCPPFETDLWGGIWNLQLRDQAVGSPLMVHVTLRYGGGRPHSVFRAAFETVAPRAGMLLESVQDVDPGHDLGLASLSTNGVFSYTRDLNYPQYGMVCRATFTGHLTN